MLKKWRRKKIRKRKKNDSAMGRLREYVRKVEANKNKRGKNKSG